MNAVLYLRDDSPELCELPVIHEHPFAEYRQTLIDAMPEPIINNMTISSLQQGRDHQSLHFYTDGSCSFPHMKHVCFASYSIVVDLLMHDVDRRTQAATFPFTQSFPTFQHIACGRLRGFQSIQRAELAAMVLLCESFTAFTAYTDSADVIHKVALCRRINTTNELAGFVDFDLLLRLYHALTPEMHILKTKAHREIGQIDDLLDRYHAMGNAAVDLFAKQTCKHLLPEVFTELETQCVNTQSDVANLQEVFALVISLQIARARAEDHRRVGQHIGDNLGGVFPKEPENTLLHWTTQHKWTRDTPWNLHWTL